jgi:UDP-N-acetylmuramate--alanine ligase
MVRQIPSGCRAWTYGLDSAADYAAHDLTSNPQGGMSFSLVYQGAPLAQIALKVPGLHNVRNALAVLGLAHQLKLPLTQVGAALAQFESTGRRFDLLGEAGGVAIYNDYAHHPTEIRTTLAAARQRYPERRIWAVWQPHTYSRTQTLFEEFTRSFEDADRVIVTEIYASREANPGFSAAQVVAAMPHPAVQFAPTLPDAVKYLLADLRAGDVVLVLSAGDADQISQQVLDELHSGEEKA